MVLKSVGLTGATGMVGRHIRALLESAGIEVVATSRSSLPGRSWDLETWCADSEFDAMFAGVQAVVHAGATVPAPSVAHNEASMFSANVRAPVNLALWAMSRGVAMVQISGGIVYADPAVENQTEAAALGWSGLGGSYGLSKLLAEDALERLRSNGLKLAVVRPSSVYGHGLAESKMLNRFIATAKAGGTIRLAPPVHDRVDMIHAVDVASAVSAILEQEAWDTFNLASGSAPSILEVAQTCIIVVGTGQVAIETGGMPGQAPVARFLLNTDRARSKLGWKPRVGLAEGLGMLERGEILPASFAPHTTRGVFPDK